MTYQTYEESRDSGQPYQLLEFRSGTEYYRYTTADHIITVAAVQYLPDNPMQSVEIKETNVDDKGKLNFQVMRDHEIAQLFLIAAPRTITLRIFGGHETDPTEDIITLWSGRVMACEWDEEDEATISCESNTTILQRNGLPYTFAASCQHTLFRGGCNLDLFAYSTLYSVTSVTDYTVTFPELIGHASNEYIGGLVINDGIDYRMITEFDNTTGVLTLIRPFENLDPGKIVRVARGCDRSSARCEQLGNFEHYLGFDTVPTRNPFEGLRQSTSSGTSDYNTTTSMSGFLVDYANNPDNQ